MSGVLSTFYVVVAEVGALLKSVCITPRASSGVSLRVYCISRVFRYKITDFYLCFAILQQFFLSVLAFCVCGRASCPAGAPKGSG